ncbi:PKD domain-containing protein [Candidatus Micrarchaeota archaeon]|nr:PKD domain-containing protein [Candidatus Micrarchaeota archaeon]
MKAYVGSHQIRLRGTKTLVYSITAKDDEGNSRTANATVRFSNTPPVVNEVSVDCTEGGANTSNCLFSVSARDPDGDPLSYTVYVNSNPRGACLNPPPSDCRTILMGNKTSARVLFGLRGEHAAVFEVTDRKSTVSLETNFTIANLAPTAAFVAPTCREGRECGFDAAPSSDDGSIASYLWLFGDGTNSTLSAPFHNYSAAGDYTVTLKVKDDEGAASSVSKQVHVQRLAVDQSSGESNDGFFQFGPSGAGLVAQQFVPSFSTVDAVRVFMWNNKGAVNISIRDSLDGDELWEVTVPFSELNSSGFTTISLNDSLSVTGGSTYYIVAEPVLYLGDLDNFRAYYVSPGNYDAGEPWVFVSGSGWQREGNDRDLNFETAYWI